MSEGVSSVSTRRAFRSKRGARRFCLPTSRCYSQAGRNPCRFSNAVGLVFTLTLFVLDYATLHVQPRLVDGSQEVAHAVGFNPQGNVQSVGGNVLEKSVRSSRTIRVRPLLKTNSLYGMSILTS